MRMTQPSEQCWNACEFSLCELELLWLYEKHRIPPEADESSFIVLLDVFSEVAELRILIVISLQMI